MPAVLRYGPPYRIIVSIANNLGVERGHDNSYDDG
jgi:hypothetical protein